MSSPSLSSEPVAPASPWVAIVGGGPAGLMAAQMVAEGGCRAVVFERMPSVARKFLMAGRGGLNLTHSEPLDGFIRRYGDAGPALAEAITAFPPDALRRWAEGLGQPCFVGSSGRIFPASMKASPLLRAWLRHLADLGVEIRTRHEWLGFAEGGGLRIASASGTGIVTPDAAILALGGASCPRLGSDGSWRESLGGVTVAPFRPSNMGFQVDWTPLFRDRFAGTPLKRIILTFQGQEARGEAMVTRTGLEGGAIYALSAALRDALDRQGPITLRMDLRPDLGIEEIRRRLAQPRRGQSLSNFLRRTLSLPATSIGLVQEAIHNGLAEDLAQLIKALPLTLTAAQGLDRAISSAGGVALNELDSAFMLRSRPGLFATGEMLDWEAPTGGYLLQACFATGRAAGLGAARWAKQQGAG